MFFMGDNADYASLCINAGCMPSKAIFEPIDAMHHAKLHGWLEVRPRQPNEYLGQIVRWKDKEVAAFRDYRNKEIDDLASDHFTILRHDARFVSEHEVVSEGKCYNFDAAIIATGSITVLPEIKGLDSTGMAFGRATRSCIIRGSRSRSRSSGAARLDWSFRCVMRALAPRLPSFHDPEFCRNFRGNSASVFG